MPTVIQHYFKAMIASFTFPFWACIRRHREKITVYALADCCLVTFAHYDMHFTVKPVVKTDMELLYKILNKISKALDCLPAPANHLSSCGFTASSLVSFRPKLFVLLEKAIETYNIKLQLTQIIQAKAIKTQRTITATFSLKTQMTTCDKSPGH